MPLHNTISILRFQLLDFIKKIFSSKFKLALFAFTTLLTFYYAFKVQEKFDYVKVADNNSIEEKYVDITEGKSFSIPIKTNSLQTLRLFCTTLDDHDFTEDDFSVEFFEIEKGFYTPVKFYQAENNSYIDILFPAYGISGLKNKLLHLKLTSDTISLKVNSNDELVYTQFGSNKFKKTLFSIFVLFLVFLGYLFIYASHKLKFHDRVFFFLVFLGCLFLFIRPPLSLYDDLVHFDSAYNMSNIMLGNGNALKTGKFVKRECDTKLFPNGNFIDKEHEHRIKISPHRYLAYLKSNVFKNYSTELVSVKPYDSLIYPQRAFFLSALCISFVRILGLNQFFLYYFTCFVNLLCFSFVIRLGLKKNRDMADNAICCIALFPVVILELASFSYDAILFAFSFTVINYAIFIFISKERKYKDILMLIIFSLILFPIKTVYFPLTGLIILNLFFNSTYLKKRNKFLIFFGTFFVMYIVALLAANFLNLYFFTKRTMTEVCYAYSMLDIIIRPLYFIKMLIYRVCDMYTPYSIDSFVGLFTLSDSLDDSIPKLLENAFVLMLVPLCCSEQKNKVIAVSSLVVFLIVSCFICLVGVSWTPLLQMDGHISGLQSRYFIPVLPLFCYSVSYFIPERFHIPIKNVFDYELILLLFYSIDRFLLVI